MKKLIALLVSTTLMAAPVAFAADDSATTGTGSDQVMQQMPGNDATAANATNDAAAVPAEHKAAKHHHAVKHKKHHHKHHHKAVAPAQPATSAEPVQPAAVGGATQ